MSAGKNVFIVIFAIVIFALVLFLTSCAYSAGTDTGIYYSFNDSFGNEVILYGRPERVVSLMGSYAEIWILAGGTLSGVTEDAVSERGMDLPGDVRIVGTVKEPNAEEVLNAAPDFVLLSADIESHRKIGMILKETRIPHAFFRVELFEDYLAMLKICTDITGESRLYEKNGTDLQAEIDKILKRVVSADAKPKVLLIRAYAAGAKAKGDDNMTGRMLSDLGCSNIAAEHPSLLDTLSIEEIIAEDPDYIFVVTMGDSENAIKAMKEGIQKNPAWKDLSAVKNDRYIILPKELFHYKPNARWGEAYEYLAEILYG